LASASSPRRVAVIGISGNGKTTVSRALAEKLGVPYIELDALYHRPGWQQAPLDEFRARVDEVTQADAWVVDGTYVQQVGDLTVDRADVVVWLDQPLPVVLWRLARRAVRDIRTRRDLFNGNRQTWRWAFFAREGLLPYAFTQHFVRRRVWPEKFAAMPHLNLVRLRSAREVERWLAAQSN
jgi:adenylate kinase family enzyme